MRISDWSSDVCSSDLLAVHGAAEEWLARLPGAAHLQRLAPGLAFLADLHIAAARSEEHTSELQSLMRISYAVFCLKKKTIKTTKIHHILQDERKLDVLTNTTKTHIKIDMTTTQN